MKQNNAPLSPWKLIVINLLIAVGVVFLVLGIVVFGMHRYTQHGKEITVPDITKLYTEEARITLEALGLRIEVIDSTYSTKVPLGTIVEQNPLAGSKVKHGRTVYVIPNAQMRRPVILPELRDISLRQAQATIATLGLLVDKITYEPSAYRDIILDVRQDNTPVEAGARLEEGSSLQLIVGLGKGTDDVTIPNVVGRSLEEARTWLLSHALTVGKVEYDIPPTEANKQSYIVYSQEPESGKTLTEGSHVNLKLSLDIEKTVTADNEQDEEEFF